MKYWILIFLLFFSSFAFAQKIQFVDSTGHLREVSSKYPLPTGSTITKFDSLFILMQNQINKGTEIIDSLSKFSKSKYIRHIYTDPDTLGFFRTTLDSSIITSTEWFSLTTYTSDSTIYLCFNRTFPLHSIITIPPGSYNKDYYDISIASYGYVYKRTQSRRNSITINEN